jgi:proteic killer suppression protein
LQVEYGSDLLRRLALEKNYGPDGWRAEDIGTYRRKLQLIGAAVNEQDLRAIRSLRFEQPNGESVGGAKIHLNENTRLAVNFKTVGDKVAVVLRLDED